MLCKLIPGSSHINDLCERFAKEVTNTDNKIVPFIIISSALALTVYAGVRWRWNTAIPAKDAALQSIAAASSAAPAATPPKSTEHAATPVATASSASGAPRMAEVDREADKLLAVLDGVIEAPSPQSPPATSTVAAAPPTTPPKLPENVAAAVATASNASVAPRKAAVKCEEDELLAILNGVMEDQSTQSPPASSTIPAALPKSTKPPAAEKSSRFNPIVEKPLEEAGVASEEADRKLFKQAADNSDVYGMYQYAKMCREGKGGQVDPFEERKYLTLAFSHLPAEHYQIAFRLGEMWEKGLGCERNIGTARYYYQIAADKGNPEALFWLAQDRLPRSKDEYDYYGKNAKALDGFLKAAEQRHLPARLKYLELTLDGRCDDYEKAKQFFKEVFNEFISSHGSLSQYAEEIMNLLKRMKPWHRYDLLARECFQKLADSSAVVGKELAFEARCEYAQMWAEGQGGERSTYKAAEIFEQIALEYGPDAPEFIEYNYKAANLFEPVNRRLICLGHAAEGAYGMPKAMHELACMYHSSGGNADLTNAREWFKRAADSTQGWEKGPLRGEAAFRYALMCDKGEGGKKDKKEAVKYIELAKQFGRKDAALPTLTMKVGDLFKRE